jgi:hypothetical protein
MTGFAIIHIADSLAIRRVGTGFTCSIVPLALGEPGLPLLRRALTGTATRNKRLANGKERARSEWRFSRHPGAFSLRLCLSWRSAAIALNQMHRFERTCIPDGTICKPQVAKRLRNAAGDNCDRASEWQSQKRLTRMRSDFVFGFQIVTWLIKDGKD